MKTLKEKAIEMAKQLNDAQRCIDYSSAESNLEVKENEVLRKHVLEKNLKEIDLLSTNETKVNTQKRKLKNGNG